jgi:HlyD family secretion protein
MPRIRIAPAALIAAACIAALAATVNAAGPDSAKPPAKLDKSKPETLAVKPGPFRITLSLDGVFEAATMHPLSLEPDAWSKLVAVDALAPGTRVKKGDVVVRFDTEELAKKIADLEAAEPLAKLGLAEAEAALALLEKTTPNKLDANRRKLQAAEEDYRRFLKLNDAFAERERRLQREGKEIRKEIAEVEMNELKKMYEADDLIETTEKHVLRRQEHRVAWAKLDQERSKRSYDWDEKIGHPRSVRDAKDKLRDAKLELPHEREALTRALEKKRLEVAALKRKRTEAAKNLADLKGDLAAMTVRAPAAGVVYYGRCVRGGWPTAGAIAKKIESGGAIGPREVFVTIVDTGSAFVRADADEKHLRDLAAGLAAEIVPTAFPEPLLAGTVKAVAIVPGGPEPYAAHVAVKKLPEAILPGMTCKVRITAIDRKQAIVVPKKAVFTKDDGETRYVLVRKNGKPVERPVTVGRSKGDRVEITKGLTKGDVIFLSKPGT